MEILFENPWYVSFKDNVKLKILTEDEGVLPGNYFSIRHYPEFNSTNPNCWVNEETLLCRFHEEGYGYMPERQYRDMIAAAKRRKEEVTFRVKESWEYE